MGGPAIIPPLLPRHPQSPPEVMPNPVDREGYPPYKIPSMQTPYMVMSLQANETPTRHNILAALFSWLILAGYVVFPGTFTSLKDSDTLGNSKGEKIIQDTIQNVPLLPLAVISCVAGTSGMCWLWWTWRKNYVWLVGQIFFPVLLNSIVGLINILVSVYTAQGGHWSATAKITIIIIGVFVGSMLVLLLVYNRLLEKIKTPYDRELAKRSRIASISDKRTAT
ncbi:hypothetical protein FGG08_005614 [Glutinoglossum americanum]|uniref:Uncharacterized protein n=1 Tax=Glutinoglossum americanum TaxID=1670608 RepID=A0A9P8I2N8_9PEZI|nr:hypothetical protein FGG08_005614 [Glutinoglossum americanum]